MTKRPSRKKKPAPPAAAPAVKSESKPSVFLLEAGGKHFTKELPRDNAWAALEKDLKPWLADHAASSLTMTYTSAALGGRVSYGFSRASGQPYTSQEIIGFVRDFAHKEMLELYGAEKPKKPKTNGPSLDI